MKRSVGIVGVAALVAILGVALISAAAMAQEPTTQPQATSGVTDYIQQMWDRLAEKLGIDRAKLDEAVKSARDDTIDQAVTDGNITADQAQNMKSRAADEPGFGLFGRMRGGMRMFGKHGGGMDCWGPESDALAKALGMTADELKSELQSGKTLEQIATEKGVDLKAAQLEAYKAQLQQAVTDGTITQDQADWMLQGMEKGYTPGRGFGGHMMMPFGKRFGGEQMVPSPAPSQSDSGTSAGTSTRTLGNL